MTSQVTYCRYLDKNNDLCHVVGFMVPTQEYYDCLVLSLIMKEPASNSNPIPTKIISIPRDKIQSTNNLYI